MAVKGTVKVGQVVVARFDSDANSGSTTVQVTFADKHGNPGPPGHCAAVPSGTCTTGPEVHASEADGLVTVLFTLPPGASGVATVIVDGAEKTSKEIKQSVIWDYPVEPR